MRGAHQLLDLLRIAYNLNRELRFQGDRFGFGTQLFISSGQKDGLNVQLALRELAEDVRDVSASDPACVDEDSELVRV